ncbi:MAG TPA: hypothetical protein VGA70_05225 [Longimicrobiales bacterium]|jgi:hypothetical protein
MRHKTTLLIALAVQMAAPLPTSGQVATQADVDAYFRAVAEHFGVPPAELAILAEWDLPPDQVPVAMFLARRVGVSPDALVALRRGGRTWGDVASRYGVDAGAFHIPLPEGTSPGYLARAFEAYRDAPRSDWPGLRLTDEEIVHLVNARFLDEVLGTAIGPVLQARERAGSWVGAYRDLAGRGG